MSVLITSLVLLVNLQTRVIQTFIVPDLNPEPYMDLQDINIGLIVSIRRPSFTRYCADNWGSPEQSQLAEMLPFVVKQTNARTDILPNITLGYVVLDGCQRDVTALGKALSLIPRGKYSYFPFTKNKNIWF